MIIYIYIFFTKDGEMDGEVERVDWTAFIHGSMSQYEYRKTLLQRAWPSIMSMWVG